MTLFTPLSSGKTIKLNDASGTDVWEVQDSEGFPMARIDSDGNLKLKGKVQRI